MRIQRNSVGCQTRLRGLGRVCGLVLGLLLGAGSSGQATVVNFQLLTSDGVGRKPSAAHPSASDWLLFTADDQTPGASYNPSGALSHNLVDMAGLGGSPFNNAPSLTGSLTLDIASSGTNNAWNVSVQGLSYSGQATPVMQMNQFLVTPGSPATLDPKYNVDGMGNSGTWSSENSANWAIQYNTDFYFATNADGDPAASDIDATFGNRTQTGYLLPVSLLNSGDMLTLTLDDPAGFYGGDFESYLLNEIKPRLPVNATYLLITQMAKGNPVYAETGLPITTSSLVGNTTIAYTTSAIPEPGTVALLLAAGVVVGFRIRKRAGK